MEEEIEKKEKRKKTIKKILKILGILLVIALIITSIILYRENRDIQNFFDENILKKTVTEKELISIEVASDSNKYICAFSRYIGILNNNTLIAYNTYAKQEFSLNINITTPIFSSNGKYLTIAEKNGNKVYLVADKNIVWQNDIEGKIEKISVNQNGYIAVSVSQTSYKSIITTYSPEGKELCKTYLSTTYTADLAISSDNKYLAIAETNLSGIQIKSGIRIISIENAKAGLEDSTTYKAEVGEDSIITSICYDSNNNLMCMLDDKILKIGNGTQKQIIKYNENTLFAEINLENQIVEVMNNDDEKLLTKIKVTNTKTEKSREYFINSLPKEIDAKGKILAINTGTEVYFINSDGFLHTKYLANQEIKEIVISEQMAGIIYKNKIEIIKF